MYSMGGFICLLLLALLQQPEQQSAAQEALQKVTNEPLWKIVATVLGALATLFLSLKGLGEVALNFLKGRTVRRAPAGAAVIKLWKFSDESAKKQKVKNKYNLLFLALICFLSPFLFAFGYIWLTSKVRSAALSNGLVTVFLSIWPLILGSYCIMGVVITNAFFVLLRLRPEHYRKVAHRTELIVEGDYEQVAAQCKGAIKALGMKFCDVDLERGVVKAKKNYRWMRILNDYGLGTHIIVRLSRQEDSKCLLSVRCGGIRSGVQLDSTNNLTRLNRFIESFMN